MTRLCLRLGISLLTLAVMLTACGGGAATEAPTAAPVSQDTPIPSGGDTPAPEATARPANEIQADVPMLDNPIDLKITNNGTVINYKAEGTVETATTFYQEQLEANGWERINKTDSGFGDSITLLRKKPDQTISVTIQSIAGSSTVRIQITLSPK
jgi:hypothetical protein